MLRSAGSSNFSVPRWKEVHVIVRISSRELTPFPDSRKHMRFYQPHSVICTLKLAGAKTSIRSTWVLGATRHYVIKSLHNTAAKIKLESLDCSRRGIHWLPPCWVNIALPVTQTYQDAPNSFLAWGLPTRTSVLRDWGKLRFQDLCPERLGQTPFHTISHTCFCLCKFAITFPPGLDWLEHSSFPSSCYTGSFNVNQLKYQTRSNL